MVLMGVYWVSLLLWALSVMNGLLEIVCSSSRCSNLETGALSVQADLSGWDLRDMPNGPRECNRRKLAGAKRTPSIARKRAIWAELYAYGTREDVLLFCPRSFYLLHNIHKVVVGLTIGAV
nr:hypothetical protein [Tanacetum cinerariifolium]